MNNPLFPGVAVTEKQAPKPLDPAAPPRLRRPDRSQALLQPRVLEEILPEDHLARIVWALVSRWDLGGFYAAIAARGERPGRPATDPKLLLALWLYAYTQNVGGGRELDRLCGSQDAYQWLCGAVSVDYHLLNDFRVDYEQELDDLLTQMTAMLLGQGLIDPDRISQDGTRVRAWAGRNSFRKEQTLAEHLERARQHVAAMKRQLEDPNVTARQRAARQRAAAEKLERLTQAMIELKQVQAAKAAQKDKPSKHEPAKASATDPEARLMRLPQGAHGPGYNVQFAATTAGRAIVGVAVTNAGSDANEAEPMRGQVQERTGRTVGGHLLDGGYVNLDAIERAEGHGVAVYLPVPKPKKPGVDPHAPKKGDGPGVIAWRERMRADEAKAVYRQRASTSETVNAETRCYRGLTQVLVRGLTKVRCVALFSALAYNVVHFGRALVG